MLPLTVLSAPNWSQPPIECVEEIVPKIPDEPCLDLTAVADPVKDFPENFSEEQKAEWKKKRRTLTVCRYQEVARRESLNPGSQSTGALQVAWMLQSAIDGREEKIAAVYKASRDYKIPYTILAGALRQESLFASLHIAPDGNNYSCSIGQFNILAWCNWISNQGAAFRQKLSWPENFSCSQLTAPIVKPFYDIAVKNLGSTPVYKLSSEQFAGIKFADVRGKLGSGTEKVLGDRYSAVMSFVNNCGDSMYGIHTKANEISRLYQTAIPAGLKKVQQYRAGESWPVQCREKGFEGAYPFQIGWLFTVGMYNAGPGIINTLSHYWGWDSKALSDAGNFANISPRELVEGLYWGGKYDKATDQVVVKTLAGGTLRSGWYKMCVVQRHLARIVQHSITSGVEPLIDSLEGANVCAAGAAAPLSRQNSSGRKDHLLEMIWSLNSDYELIPLQ